MQVVERAIALDPEERYANASELLAALSGLKIGAHGHGCGASLSRARRRRGVVGMTLLGAITSTHFNISLAAFGFRDRDHMGLLRVGTTNESPAVSDPHGHAAGNHGRGVGTARADRALIDACAGGRGGADSRWRWWLIAFAWTKCRCSHRVRWCCLWRCVDAHSRITYRSSWRSSTCLWRLTISCECCRLRPWHFTTVSLGLQPRRALLCGRVVSGGEAGSKGSVDSPGPRDGRSRGDVRRYGVTAFSLSDAVFQRLVPFEAATWNGSRCYIIGERDDDRLLYCPEFVTAAQSNGQEPRRVARSPRCARKPIQSLSKWSGRWFDEPLETRP